MINIEKLFVGTKVIKALAMTRDAYNDLRGWCTPQNENGNDAGYLVEYLDSQEQNHKDYAHYISWSPKEVFEKTYSSNGHFTFGDALLLAGMGYALTRTLWDGTNEYVFIRPTVKMPPINSVYHETAMQVMSDKGINPATENATKWMFRGCGSELSEWNPTGADTLAKDWKIARPRGMTAALLICDESPYSKFVK